MKSSSRLLAACVVAMLGVPSTPAQYSPTIPKPKELKPRKQAQVDAFPLGSEKNPVRCDGPKGARAYLERLRCPSGDAPTHQGLGGDSAGPYTTVVTRFSVSCPGFGEPVSVFTDMYHDGFVESRAPEGFEIVAAPDEAAASDVEDYLPLPVVQLIFNDPKLYRLLRCDSRGRFVVASSEFPHPDFLGPRACKFRIVYPAGKIPQDAFRFTSIVVEANHMVAEFVYPREGLEGRVELVKKRWGWHISKREF